MDLDTDYYKELQNTLRSYDQKLWQIPSLFFFAVGFIITNIKKDSDIKNGFILLVGSLFLWILILLYTKAHIFNISIQKKINEFDNIQKNQLVKRIPLVSMTNKELRIRMNELENKYLENKKNNEGAIFTFTQRFLAERTVSLWIRRSMISTLIISLVFSVYYFVSYIL